ncbi:hypothetical protein BKA57DRAFT_465563 [Linnemannia elongata]|nr:hypothetical protein BKA57DRAFT_465563 [Linnemannia elongata]
MATALVLFGARFFFFWPSALVIIRLFSIPHFSSLSLCSVFSSQPHQTLLSSSMSAGRIVFARRGSPWKGESGGKSDVMRPLPFLLVFFFFLFH